jgi:hypothetical protein
MDNTALNKVCGNFKVIPTTRQVVFLLLGLEEIYKTQQMLRELMGDELQR